MPYSCMDSLWHSCNHTITIYDLVFISCFFLYGGQPGYVKKTRLVNIQVASANRYCLRRQNHRNFGNAFLEVFGIIYGKLYYEICSILCNFIFLHWPFKWFNFFLKICQSCSNLLSSIRIKANVRTAVFEWLHYFVRLTALE